MELSYWITLSLLFLTIIGIACSIISSFKNPKVNLSTDGKKIEKDADLTLELKKYEFIVDLAKDTYSKEIERITNLDNKANTIMGFVSVAISLLIGFGAIEILEKVTIKNYLMIYFLAIGILVFAVVTSLCALGIRTYNYAPNISRLNKNYISQGTYRWTLRKVLNAFEDSINTIGNQNDNKAKWIKMSWHLILIGLILIFIFFILTFSYK